MTLADRACAALRRDIVTGALAPGQPLRMAMLCDRYGMGMSPLREALNRLQAERLVDVVPLRGFTVASLSLADLADTTETRILIETRALTAAIARGDGAWAQGIGAALDALAAASARAPGNAEPDPDPEALERAHLAFHHALIAACGSRWLLSFFGQLYAESERYRHVSLASGHSPPRRDIDAEHRAIAEATLARDTDRACALLAAHYRRTRDFVLARLADGTGAA